MAKKFEMPDITSKMVLNLMTVETLCIVFQVDLLSQVNIWYFGIWP